MTKLFPLAPFGLGTPLVESFTSYLGRLSVAHDVSIHQLLRALHGTPEETRLNGYSMLTRRTVAAVSRLTAQPALSCTTLLRFRRVLAGNSNDSVVSSRRWCPRCIDEEIKRGEHGYDPLMWSVAAVVACPVHDLLLLSSCAECRRSQPLVAYQSGNRNHCVFCGSCLDAEQICHALMPEDKWARAQFSELLSQPATRSYRGFPVHVVLTGLVREAGSVAEAAAAIGMPADNFRNLLSRKGARPKMSTVVRIAAGLQQSIDAILDAPEDVIRQAKFAFSYLSRAPGKNQRPSPIQRSRLKCSLKIAAEAPDSLVAQSVAEICSSVGVSVGFAGYACPELVALVGQRRARARILRSRQQADMAKQAVRALVATAERDGLALPSIRNIVICLMASTGVPKRVLRNAIKTTLGR